jgi:hypothetical protein
MARAVAVMHYFDIFSGKLEARKWKRESDTTRELSIGVRLRYRECKPAPCAM